MPLRHPVTTRETSDAEQRARARERAATTARNGTRPSEEYSPEDLAWAFAGHEEELAALEELAAAAPEAEAELQEQRERRRQLQAMTDRVLAEQEAERRQAAEQEARRRLGWDTPKRKGGRAA